jgi:hypothetical protein
MKTLFIILGIIIFAAEFYYLFKDVLPYNIKYNENKKKFEFVKRVKKVKVPVKVEYIRFTEDE